MSRSTIACISCSTPYIPVSWVACLGFVKASHTAGAEVAGTACVNSGSLVYLTTFYQLRSLYDVLLRVRRKQNQNDVAKD